jgi:hypothetical protein
MTNRDDKMGPDQLVEASIRDALQLFVDHMLPEFTPYEAALYMYLFRKTALGTGTSEVRMGKRTIAAQFGKGNKDSEISYKHLSDTLAGLSQRGVLTIGDTTRSGTLYRILFPTQIKWVIEKAAAPRESCSDDNYFEDPSKRRVLFERDAWRCSYCGEKLDENTATLDHWVPQCRGGTDEPENLRTSCLICNSIKSGRTYEEAAPDILKRIQKTRSGRE